MPIPIKPALMHATVYARISNDQHVADVVKSNLIDLCAACADETALETAFNGYAKANRLTGTSMVVLVADEVVGHVKNLRSACSFLAAKLTMSHDDVEGYFRALAGHGTTLQQEEAALWFSEDVAGHHAPIAVSGSPCWLFRDASHDVDTAFSSADLNCIPTRLGLPELLGAAYVPGLEFVGYQIPGADVGEARLPTFLDGSYSSVRDIWIETGMSQPIPTAPASCTTLGGFGEMVSEPPGIAKVKKFHLMTT